MRERTKLLLMLSAFAGAYFLPVENARVQSAFLEGFFLLKDYARQHVLLCLVPAFFIAGAIGQFVRQGAVLRYLGAKAPRPVAYGVASVSGSILAVCSCTVLPLFAGIYRRGAGLGPATAFLYSGPAINVLAMILTARVLGLELGVARAVGAVGFAVVVGLIMAALFRREEEERQRSRPDPFAAAEGDPVRRPWQDALFLAAMIAVLVFANWGAPTRAVGLFAAIHRAHWPLTAAALVALLAMMRRWYEKEELAQWVQGTWGFAKQITPLLLVGIVVSGWLMGRPGHDTGLLPSSWIASSVGGNGAGFEPARLGRRGLHVLRHPHRGPDPPDPARVGDGPGAGSRAAAGGARAVAPEHDRHPLVPRHAEDRRLRLAGGPAARPSPAGGSGPSWAEQETPPCHRRSTPIGPGRSA